MNNDGILARYAPQMREGWFRALFGGQGEPAGERARSFGAAAVWALIAVYIAFFGTLTVLKHNAFQTTAFDLGNVDQAVWNTRHGRPFAMTNIEGLSNRLGTHVEPILLPISLLYFVWSDPRALLILQTVVIALGAWPVYLLVKFRFRERGNWAWQHEMLALSFAFAYLLFPALQSANVFDFHALALAPTFFLFAFYFLETERWGGYALFVLLTMSCKEDMPLLVAMLGLYALVVRRKWRAGLVTVAVAAVWFLLAVGWVMPHYDTRGVSPFANRYAYLGDGPLEMALTMVTRPGLWLEPLFSAERLAYLRDLLAPVAFLSLLAPQVLALALPSLLVNLLSSEGAMHSLEGFHYGAILAPITVVSAAYGVAWLCSPQRAWLSGRSSRLRPLSLLLVAVILAASLAYHFGHGYTPLAADFGGSWPVVTSHHRLGEEIAGRIPEETSLAALPFPNPHGSQRQQLTMIERVDNGMLAPLHDAAYAWLDVTNGWPLHPNDLKAGVENLLANDYGVDEAADGWLLLRRGATDRTLPDAFYDFARVSDPQPQHAMRLQFMLDGKAVLECMGFDLAHDRRAGTYRLTFYWRALQPLPADLRLYPYYFDDTTGQIVEDTSLRPMIATVWYPPERWETGEIVATSMLPWDVGSTFSVGLGVVQGDGWSVVPQRLPIRVETSDLVVRLFDGDTWARLLHVREGELVEEYRSFARPSLQNSVDADFEGRIRLLGYDLECEDRRGVCDLGLFWQAQARMDTSYTVFAQLLGPAGQVRAQVDAVPQGGGYPTQWWLPGEVVSDSLNLELPAGAPLDVTYRLIVGWYDPATGDRLLVSSTGAGYVELASPQFD